MADEDFAAVEKKALKSGAKKVYVIDLQVLQYAQSKWKCPVSKRAFSFDVGLLIAQ